MKRIFLFSILIILSVSCNAQEKSQDVFNKKYPLVFHQYKEASLPVFFDQLFRNHYDRFKEKYFHEYKSVCDRYALELDDSLNQVTFFKVVFFQQLMTSGNPSNCSQKGALQIPYFWNWVSPNPRSEIISLTEFKTLDKIKPEKEFAKYKSVAYIDRTPALFLQDLVSEKARYFHPSCDTIYTFGWCSEREMAFNLLLSFYNYKGKVIVNGAHSWSEFWVEFKKTDKSKKSLIIKADNTYDGFSVDEKPLNVLKAQWLNDFGSVPLAKWYNQKAYSSVERQKIQNTIVKKQASNRIESMIHKYLK